jgi:hypothetical protein
VKQQLSIPTRRTLTTFSFKEDREERIGRSPSRNQVTSRLFRASLPRRAIPTQPFFRVDLALPSPQKEACETHYPTTAPPKSKPGSPPPTPPTEEDKRPRPPQSKLSTKPSNLPTFLPRPLPRSVRHGINDSPCPVTSIETSPIPPSRQPQEIRASETQMRHPFLQLPTDLENHPGTTGISTSHLPGCCCCPPLLHLHKRNNTRTNGRMNQRRLCNDAYTSCPCMQLPSTYTSGSEAKQFNSILFITFLVG